ncbi:MAG: helix-turn-helix transcriptional regulator [Verrucomicrobiia bacterium]
MITLPPMKNWTPRTIKKLRKTAGITQTQLAACLGVTRVHVTHLESGFRPPGPQTAQLLNFLAERVKSGEIKAVHPRKIRGKPKRKRGKA